MSHVTCSMCGEGVEEGRAIAGDSGVICVECVWMCVDILEERGEKRPARSTANLEDEFDEKSEVHPRGTVPPPPK